MFAVTLRLSMAATLLPRVAYRQQSCFWRADNEQAPYYAYLQ